ncbi:hypothetical protein U9M48_019453 [Paspalum notatum var. saurae]|uniref:Uncharacterized protein n=1 Tax=Paspalum notatum var. saurae TaxID=547442 RepID=A0AAQ3TD76_PASNO
MAQACALANEAEEVYMAPLLLEEPRAQVLLGGRGRAEGGDGALVHGHRRQQPHDGSRAAFTELDSAVMGTVWFGDNSVVTIPAGAPSSSTAEGIVRSPECITFRG